MESRLSFSCRSRSGPTADHVAAPSRVRSTPLTTGSMKSTRSLGIAGAFAVAALSGGLQAQQIKPAPGAKPPPPLSPMASQHVMVLPAQLMRADSGAWMNVRGGEKFGRELDDSIGRI